MLGSNEEKAQVACPNFCFAPRWVQPHMLVEVLSQDWASSSGPDKTNAKVQAEKERDGRKF